MKKILIFLFFICSIAGLSAQNKDALVKSDSLFSKGVELYNLQKYREAIPLFEESDQIDKTELDSLCNRRDYSSMWLAAYYKQLGDEDKAKQIYPANIDTPVDRRLTVVSDSLFREAANARSEDDEITNLLRGYELEKVNVGRTHQYTVNSLVNICTNFAIKVKISNIYIEKGDTAMTEYLNEYSDKLKEYFKELHEVAIINPNLEISDFNTSLIISAIYDISANLPEDERIQSLNDMIDVAALSRKDSGDTWISLIKLKASIFEKEKDYTGLYKYISYIYDDFYKLGIRNRNLYEIESLLGTALYKVFLISESQEFKEECVNKRMEIYEHLLILSEEIWGRNSVEYASSLIKIANLDLGTGLEFNLDMGKSVLIDGLEILFKPEVMSVYGPDKIYEILSGTRSTINEASAYEECIFLIENSLPYLQNNSTPQTLMNFKAELADLYADLHSTEGTQRAVELYTELINDSHNNPQNKVKFLKKRGFRRKLNHDYENALSDYLEVEQLYDTAFPLPENFLTKSIYNDVKYDIFNIYADLGNDIKAIEYQNKFAQLCQDLIVEMQEDNHVYSSWDDDYRLKIIEQFAQCYVGTKDYKYDNYDKAIEIFNTLLELLPHLNPRNTSRYNWERNTYQSILNTYLLKKDFNAGVLTVEKLKTIATEHDDIFTHISAMNGLSRLYETVSIEPELAVDTKLEAVIYLSEYISNNLKKFNKNELQILKDFARHEWDECLDLLEYLGDENGINTASDKMFNFIEYVFGDNSPEYIKAKVNWLSYFIIPRYYSWNTNNVEEGREQVQRLVRLYEENRNNLANYKIFNYKTIGKEFYYLKDYSSARKYYDLFESELKADLPESYTVSKEYLSLLEDKADLCNDKEQKYKQLVSLMPMYETIEDDIPNQYSSYLYKLYYLAVDLKLWEDAILYSTKCIRELKDEDFLDNLIRCLLQTRNYEDILPIFSQASIYARTDLLSHFKAGSSDRRKLVWDIYYKVPFSLGEGLYEKFPDLVSPATIYDNLLMRKNILLSASISAENLIQSEGDSLLLAKLERKHLLEDFLHSNAENIENNGHIISREQAVKLVQRFDEEIMSRAAMLGDITETFAINWRDVESVMNKDDVMIEFSNYSSLDGEKSYGAAVLTKGNEPKYIPLFKEKELEKLNFSSIYGSSEIYNLIWEPLEEYFQDKRCIYFAPDGMLYNIAIEYVPTKTLTLMTDSYNIHRLSSSRELVTRRPNNTNNINSVLFGGMKYDTDASYLEQDMKKYPELRTRNLSPVNIADSLNLRMGAAELPETLVEVDNIKSSFKKHQIIPKVFKGLDGTEASFKSLSGKNINLIHIATHGFYLTDQDAQRSNILTSFQNLENNPIANSEDKALSRSGLLFTGANNALRGVLIPENVEDGILTAKEISQLDLRNLDLIALSACQTGLGEITGDGVFGLQRGFKKAGAKSLLMSLWKVDDRATQMLMSNFYEYFLSGKSKLESLILAQKCVREYEEEVQMSDESNMTGSQKRRNQRQGEENERVISEKIKIKPYADPKYWAAFILLDALD